MSRSARLARTVLIVFLVLLVLSAVFPPVFPVVLLASGFAVLAYLRRVECV